jgi:hypothetical protein
MRQLQQLNNCWRDSCNAKTAKPRLSFLVHLGNLGLRSRLSARARSHPSQLVAKVGDQLTNWRVKLTNDGKFTNDSELTNDVTS